MHKITQQNKIQLQIKTRQIGQIDNNIIQNIKGMQNTINMNCLLCFCFKVHCSTVHAERRAPSRSPTKLNSKYSWYLDVGYT